MKNLNIKMKNFGVEFLKIQKFNNISFLNFDL
jgi:hypothetical protein